MGLLLHFQKTRGSSVSKGPFERIVFESETVREKAGGAIIATHFPHTWAVDGEEFLRLDVEPTVVVSWEGFGGSPSTTGHLSCVNGIAFIDRRIFAVVDREHGDWYLLREGQHQAVLELQPAPPSDSG
jgi:hypothetical protein